MNPVLLSRRNFIERAALAAAFGAAGPLAALGQKERRFQIIAFSKPFAHLNFEDTADFVADIGWDGIECPVRSKSGHIAPEKVAEDLPKMVEALKKRGKEVTLVTTEITKIDPLAEKVLRTMAKLGIRKYRLNRAASRKQIPISSVGDSVDAGYFFDSLFERARHAARHPDVQWARLVWLVFVHCSPTLPEVTQRRQQQKFDIICHRVTLGT